MKLNDVRSICELYFEAKKRGKNFIPGIPSPLYSYEFDDGGCVLFGLEFSSQIENSKKMQKYYDLRLRDYIEVMRQCFRHSRSFYMLADEPVVGLTGS